MALPLSDLKSVSLSACEGMDPESAQHAVHHFPLLETSQYTHVFVAMMDQTLKP